ncbi:MAG TPA: hypothetical protein VJT73_06020, partial [Polyangiaceae bacterium]|nr:hypothetical protein [Polyangiaceae bacterium]
GDPLVVEAVTLQRAFVEITGAKKAASAGDASAVCQNLEAARRRIDHVRRPRGEGMSLCDQSDDIRSTLRVLEALLTELGTSCSPSKR